MKKEIRENNEARRLLTDEEVELVAGGTGPTPDGYLPPTHPTGDVNISQSLVED